MQFRFFLFVCQGNICRSPMAEGYFRHQLAQEGCSTTVGSAGLGALVGYPADPKAQTLMLRHGIDISAHRARQLNLDIVKESDVIFVMTEQQRSALEQQFSMAKGRTFLLGKWRQVEIRDPYKAPDAVFEEAYHLIVQSWQDWKQKLIPGKKTLQAATATVEDNA